MAAGLGFKDFTTGEVLTAADVDGYLMQGVWVFASAAARDAAVTSPQEGNFAYLKDTNVTTYYTGSAWANLDTTGMTNPMTTTGDTIYASPGSTPVRLGIGSTGNVLTVSGGVPTWAAPAGGGGMTLLSTTTLSGASTTISSIDQTYTDLVAVFYGMTNATANGGILVRPNNSTTISNHVVNDSTSGSAAATVTVQNTDMLVTYNAVLNRTDANNAYVLEINNYANTTFYKPFNFYGNSLAAPTSYRYSIQSSGAIATNSAITSLVFIQNGGNWSTGTVLLYGVK